MAALPLQGNWGGFQLPPPWASFNKRQLLQHISARRAPSCGLQIVLSPRSSVLRTAIDSAVFKEFSRLRRICASHGLMRRRWISSVECHYYVTDPDLAAKLLSSLEAFNVPNGPGTTSTTVYSFPIDGPMFPFRVRLNVSADLEEVLATLSHDGVEAVFLDASSDRNVFADSLTAFSRTPPDVDHIEAVGCLVENVVVKPIPPLVHRGARRSMQMAGNDPTPPHHPSNPPAAVATPGSEQQGLREQIFVLPAPIAQPPEPQPAPQQQVAGTLMDIQEVAARSTAPSMTGTNSQDFQMPLATLFTMGAAGVGDTTRSRATSAEQRGGPAPQAASEQASGQGLPPNFVSAGTTGTRVLPQQLLPHGSLTLSSASAHFSQLANESYSEPRANPSIDPTRPAMTATAQQDIPPTTPPAGNTANITATNTHSVPMDIAAEVSGSPNVCDTMGEANPNEDTCPDDISDRSSTSSQAAGTRKYARRSSRIKRNECKKIEKKTAEWRPKTSGRRAQVDDYFTPVTQQDGEPPQQLSLLPTSEPPAQEIPTPPDPAHVSSNLPPLQPPAGALSPLGFLGPSHV